MGPGGQSGTRRKHRLGYPLASKIKVCFRRRRRGGSSLPPPRRNQRLMIPIPPLAGPRALEALGPYEIPFFQRTKGLPHFCQGDDFLGCFAHMDGVNDVQA